MSAPAPKRRAGVAVRIERARRVFPGGVVALAGIDLDIAAGEIVALLGPSGCGKSTLLRLVAGLDTATTGAVELRAEGAKPRLAYVFQDAHLLPWRSVVDNVALPLELAGTSRDDRARAAREALRRVGLGDALDRFPAELSGGMRMRASLARALVTAPDLLLLDEPFAALDELTRQRLDDDLRALWAELGMTVLFVTHSIAEATYLAERAVVLSGRPARVLCDRRVDLPAERRGAMRADAAFAREMRVLYDVLEHDATERGCA